MARLPYVSRDELPEDARAFFDSRRLPSGQPMNIHRMMAHSPKLMLLRSAFAGALLNETRLDPRLRELALLTVGRVTAATYEYHHHLHFGRRAGITEAQIAALPVWQRHPAFSEQERTVIRYAEEMTRDVRVADATFAAIRELFDDEQIVELTLAIAHYNSTVRFLEALQVDVEAE